MSEYKLSLNPALVIATASVSIYLGSMSHPLLAALPILKQKCCLMLVKLKQAFMIGADSRN